MPYTNETEASPLRERAETLAWQVKQRMEPVDAWVRTLVRERPLVALAGALGIGYLVGRLIRRI
jgi:ElaB/YqjD/DUF883 family membrane-anchored ribosome-binding protein